MSEEFSPPPEAHETQLFIKNGEPAGFLLHKSIKDPAKRKNLEEDIIHHGGCIVHDDSDPAIDTVLILQDGVTNKEVLQTSYHADKDRKKRGIYVEYSAFVRKCIGVGMFQHALDQQVFKGMGGVMAGSRWVVSGVLRIEEC